MADYREPPLVQWTFLQFKKTNKKVEHPAPLFLHSATQVGSKIVVLGGCNYFGEALKGLFVYDTLKYEWNTPGDASRFQEDHGGARYGHTATLVEMHPPRIMIYGGMMGGSAFEFDESPDSAMDEGEGEGGAEDDDGKKMARPFMSWRRKKGKVSYQYEEMDEAVYFLTLNSESWTWSKPLVPGTRNKKEKPPARAEHSAVKTATNEVTVFGGWLDAPRGPSNCLWTFNFVDLEWKEVSTSGIHPRPRYRHTAEVIGQKMFVLGGSDNGEDQAAMSHTNLSMHALDLETLKWSHPTLRGVNPFPRSGHGSAVVGACTLAVFGGKRSNEWYLNDVILIDVNTLTSSMVNAVESCLPTPISNCSLTAVGQRLFVFGGTDLKGDCYNDIRSLEVGEYLSSSDITVGEGAASDYSFKILIIGDASVGKSAILTRFSENVFLDSYTTTIGIDYNSKMIRVSGAVCKLEIWDTAGQERFSTITANYYRGAQGAMLVYDIARKDSFDAVKKWFTRARQLGGEDLECILVGNKCDLDETERQVSFAMGEALGTELGIPFVETSAFSGANVQTAFVRMTTDIKKSVDRRGLTGVRSGNMTKSGGVHLARGDRRMKVSERCCGGI